MLNNKRLTNLTNLTTLNLKTLKYHTFSMKQFFLLFVKSVIVTMIQNLNKKNLMKYKKLLF